MFAVGCVNPVDGGASVLAALQPDVIATMAKAGQSRARGVRQPARSDDQRLERRALVAPQQFDHASDLGPLPGVDDTGADLAFEAAELRAVAAIPAVAPAPDGAGSAAPTMFDVSSPVEAPTLSSGCELSSLVATAFNPAAVRFNANARPASSSRRQTGMFGLALISRTRRAARSLAASFSAAGRFRLFGAVRQRSSRREAALKMRSCASVRFDGGVHRNH